MSLQYKKILIYTSEGVQFHGKLLYNAVVEYIRSLKLAARCTVNRGIVGYYENGEISTSNILDLSYNLPITIEVLIPAVDLENVLPPLEEMITDGIIAIENLEVQTYRAAKHLFPVQLKVKEIMTPSPTTVPSTMPVSTIITLMQDKNLKGIPVVDERLFPIGIITSGDLMTKAGLPIRPGLLKKLDAAKVQSFINAVDCQTAQDIMSTPLVTIKDQQLIKEAIQIMIRHRLKRLPVINSSGMLVGMLSRIDIFQAITNQSPKWHSLQEQHVIVGNSQPVKEIIERDLETVYPDTKLPEIIEKISCKDLQRVAVINRDGQLIGLISDADLMPYITGQSGFWEHLRSKLIATGKKRKIDELMPHSQASAASEIMIQNPITIQEEATIDEAVQLMTEKGLKRLPVIDSQGMFKGMISRDSILQTVVQ